MMDKVVDNSGRESTLRARPRISDASRYVNMSAPPEIPDSIRLLSPRAIERLATEVPIETIIEGIQYLINAKIGDPPEDGEPDLRRRDTRALEAGLKLWLSYVIGLPVQRQEIVTHKLTGTIDPVQLIANPATLDALARQAVAAGAEGKLLEAIRAASEKPAKLREVDGKGE